MMINWNSQLFMHQLLMEHHHLSDNPADQEHTMAPIFDTIIEHIPAPVDNSDEPLQFQVSLLDYNDFRWSYRYWTYLPWNCKSW